MTVLSDTDQFNIINTRDWYTAMRTASQSILGAMQTNNFDIAGDDAWIETVVENIQVRFHVNGQDVHAQVAMMQNGDWMYDWHFPIGWVTT